MAFTARLFVLLAITIPILAVINDLPNKFPTGNAQDTDIDDVMSRLERFGFKPTIQLLVNVTFRAEEQPQACDRTEHSYVSKLPKFKVAAPQERRRPRMSRFVQFIYVIFLLFYVDRQL
ncbi:hypothetical protein QTP88_011078 [Uroleucon formosanum]